MVETKLTEEQIKKVRQLEFLYCNAAPSYIKPADNELLFRVLKLDEEIRRHALAKALAEGIFGSLLLITGFNLLTKLSGSFLAGIIIFCIGAIILATSYPLYNFLIQRKRKKYAPVVLTVTKYLGLD